MTNEEWRQAYRQGFADGFAEAKKVNLGPPPVYYGGAKTNNPHAAVMGTPAPGYAVNKIKNPDDWFTDNMGYGGC